MQLIFTNQDDNIIKVYHGDHCLFIDNLESLESNRIIQALFSEDTEGFLSSTEIANLSQDGISVLKEVKCEMTSTYFRWNECITICIYINGHHVDTCEILSNRVKLHLRPSVEYLLGLVNGDELCVLSSASHEKYVTHPLMKNVMPLFKSLYEEVDSTPLVFKERDPFYRVL